MRKAKLSYIIQSSVVMGVWTLVMVIVSIKIYEEDQLPALTKFAVWGFIWGLIIYFIVVLIHYYKKLDEADYDR